jgi:hypothetical protein
MHGDAYARRQTFSLPLPRVDFRPFPSRTAVEAKGIFVLWMESLKHAPSFGQGNV